MLSRMAKVGLHPVIRCITSRQICFPLIFTIATISLVATLTQFSHIDAPNVNLVWNSGENRVLQRKRVRGLWEEWIPQREDTRAKKMNKPPVGVFDVTENEDVLQKMKLPFTSNNFKANVRRSKPKPQSKQQINNQQSTNRKQNSSALTDDVQTWRTWRQTWQTWRQWVEKRTNESEATIDVDKYLRLKGTVDDPFQQADIPRTSNVSALMKKSLPEQTRGVIIVTNYRSGSTFLGELFNQHPQAFYTFEPLYPFGANCSFEVSRRVQTLRSILACSFPVMRRLYEQLSRKMETNRVHASCIRNNFCFRYNHKDLCSRDMCPLGNPESCMTCGPVDLSLASKKCRSRKVSVIKIIKLCYVESLEPLFQDPSLDLKIIHLVRDPRGIASSRLKIHPDWDVADNIITTCQRQTTNVKAGRKQEWLKGRYKLIRYEDIAANPLGLAKEIYDFVGLHFSDSVRNWIVQNTQSKGSKVSNVRAKMLSMKKQEYSAEEDPYSTARDSSTAMQAWRNHLSFATNEKIQKHCFETMRTLGYTDFKTEGDLLNLNISALLSL